MRSMFLRVQSSGWIPFLMAAFSAGSPKASNPMGFEHVAPLRLEVAVDRVADDVVAPVAGVQEIPRKDRGT